MQPAPLTGTTTSAGTTENPTSAGCSPHPSRGQQPCTATPSPNDYMDAARTPHGDNNTPVVTDWPVYLKMQPAPLTGTTTLPSSPPFSGCPDAARTPHGDSNRSCCWMVMGYCTMQSAPLTGTATQRGMQYLSYLGGCSPHPSRGQQPFRPCGLSVTFSDAACTPHGDKKGGVTQGSV